MSPSVHDVTLFIRNYSAAPHLCLFRSCRIAYYYAKTETNKPGALLNSYIPCLLVLFRGVPE